jgi:hypothetical protein
MKVGEILYTRWFFGNHHPTPEIEADYRNGIYDFYKVLQVTPKTVTVQKVYEISRPWEKNFIISQTYVRESKPERHLLKNDGKEYVVINYEKAYRISDSEFKERFQVK